MKKGDGAALTILRYDPAKPPEPYYNTYSVRATKDTTVLDALFQILETQDHSLAFRYSCRSAVCGSCAMFINGRYRLACSTLISEIGRDVIVQPLPHMPIIKDLVVDLATFFEKYKVVKPYLVPIKPPPEKEWIQSPRQRSKINDSTDCILCAACYSSCPSVWTGKKYLGPAAILWAYRFAADSRDDNFSLICPANCGFCIRTDSTNATRCQASSGASRRPRGTRFRNSQNSRTASVAPARSPFTCVPPCGVGIRLT